MKIAGTSKVYEDSQTIWKKGWHKHCKTCSSFENYKASKGTWNHYFIRATLSKQKYNLFVIGVEEYRAILAPKIVWFRNIEVKEQMNSLFPGCKVEGDSRNDPKPEGSISTHSCAPKSQGLKLIDRLISSQQFSIYAYVRNKVMNILTAHASASHPVQDKSLSVSHACFPKTEFSKPNLEWGLPWSKSSPKGLDELVRLACLPSTASKVCIHISTCILQF